MVDIYRAIADSTRRTILDELCERDDQTLFEICARLTNKHGLGLSRQAVSQHLEALESARLVRSRKEGRFKFHQIDPSPLEEITARWPRNASRSSRGAADAKNRQSTETEEQS
ncbi:ArsR/SmtB family transcription factor [Brevibacterium siliguriense]|uniref:ArsR/SmtB family transcription factor n=1 Tax=Brevibacterium siliguriense TaxID=1136497 RepID=UPI0018D42582|nr:metalloregulator ArsR/SmtB family transcription factor [Brevibacterium siliguriense]